MNNATIGKVNDIKGFFRTYQELKAEHFNSLFGEEVTENDVMTLDYCLSDLYGSRCLQSRFADIFNNQSANDCMTRIVIIADRLYFENWLNTKQTIEKALLTDLEKPLTSEKTGENFTENKVNAFDGETSSDKDNSTHNYNEITQYSNGKTATQNAKIQIDFTRNNDFLEIIINDVLSMCCLSIYDDNYTHCRASGGGESDPGLENRVEQCESDITNIKKVIPATATEQNKLATIADVQSGYDDTEIRELIEGVENQIPDVTNLATKSELQAVENQIPDVSGLVDTTTYNADKNVIIDDITETNTKINAIETLIPTNASATNKLATMADVGGGGGGSYYTVGQEVDTGNIYKNGNTEKPIYRKVIEVSSVTQGSPLDIQTSFTNVSRFLNISGSYNLNGIRHCLGYYYDNSYRGVQAEVRPSLIRVSVLGTGLTFTDISLIIEYIK